MGGLGGIGRCNWSRLVATCPASSWLPRQRLEADSASLDWCGLREVWARPEGGGKMEVRMGAAKKGEPGMGRCCFRFNGSSESGSLSLSPHPPPEFALSNRRAYWHVQSEQAKQ